MVGAVAELPKAFFESEDSLFGPSPKKNLLLCLYKRKQAICLTIKHLPGKLTSVPNCDSNLERHVTAVTVLN